MKYSDHLLFTLGVAALLSVVLVPDGVAQRRQDIHAQSSVRGPTQRGGASALSRRAARQARLHALRGTLPGRSVDPTLVSYAVVVQPAGRGFHDLQDALDFCGRQNSTRSALILLAAGTYTGNFVLPPSGVVIVGTDGTEATTIVGQTGVMQPTLRFAPSGGSPVQSGLCGVILQGKEVAALDYSGSNADAGLWLEQCRITTEKAIPAIRMSGGGFSADALLHLDLSNIEMDSLGDGIQANIGAFVEIFCGRSIVAAEGTAFDLTASSSQSTQFILWNGAVFGQRCLNADGVGIVSVGDMHLEAANGVVSLTNVPAAMFLHGDMNAAGGDALLVSGSHLDTEYFQISVEDPLRYGVRALAGSTANVAHCGFFTGTSVNAVSVDGSSAKNTIFNHWGYTLLP